MIIAPLIFYTLAFMLILSALLVISARNPVHAVLFLILAFFNASGLFVLLGAEFIAFILAIVYVGAVAVLFLFVVMMLDVSFESLKGGAVKYVPVGMLVGGVLLAEIALMMFGFSSMGADNIAAPVAADVSNTHNVGRVLYTQYILPFQVSGVILLVAMIGAIVLTLRVRPGVRRQTIYKQVNTKIEDVLEVRRVQFGAGVQIPDEEK